MNVPEHYSCDCNACEFRKASPTRSLERTIKPVQLIQEKDFGLLLRKLQAPNKLTRSVRVRILDTMVFLEGEFKFIAYYDESDGYIKFTPKCSLQQARNFMNDRRQSDSILIKYYDSNVYIQIDNVQVSSQNELLHIIMKRKIDPIWGQLLCIHNFDINKTFDLYHFDFNYEIDSKDELFLKAKIEIMILNGEIPRASSDFVPIAQEEAYEQSLCLPEYCRYVAYKIIHYVEIFGYLKIIEGRFSFYQKTLCSVEKMETITSHRQSYFDSEILLKRKKIENEDDFFCERIIEQNVKIEREHALEIYKRILEMDTDKNDPSFIARNKLAVIGFDPKKYHQQLKNKFQQCVSQSKDPVNTLKALLQEQKQTEEKLSQLMDKKH